MKVHSVNLISAADSGIIPPALFLVSVSVVTQESDPMLFTAYYGTFIAVNI